MSLRSFILMIWTGALLTIFALFYVQSEEILGRVFSDLESTHRETARHTAQSMLQAQTLAFETLRKSLENDNSLSSALITAREHGRVAALRPELERRARAMNVDQFDLIYSDGTSVAGTAAELHVGWKAAMTGESRFSVLANRGNPLLVSISPLRNYREIVGAVLLTLDLNRHLANSISRFTRSTVLFFPADSVDALTTGQGLIPLGEELPSVGLSIESGYLPKLNISTRRHMIGLGTLSLLLIAGLLHCLLEFGFVRQFKRLLASIQDVASNLDREEDRAVAVVAHPIREIDLLSRGFSKFSESLSLYKRKIRERSHAEARVFAAEQVAHDLKSPLSAMEMILESGSPESDPSGRETRLRQCLDRIRGTLRLLSKERPPVGNVATESLQALISDVVAEKTLQYVARPQVGLRVELATSPIYATIDGDDFKRVLSNIIDNAYQAILQRGVIQVGLVATASGISLTIEDNGTGIDARYLTEIGNRGFTLNRPEGQGLGIWNAASVIRAVGGDLKFESALGRGTTVTLILPPAPATEEVS